MRAVDLLDDVHAGDDTAKDGKPMAIENDAVAVSGPLRAIDSAPSMFLRPVTDVRSIAIGGY